MLDWVGRDGGAAADAGGEEAWADEGGDVGRESEGATGDDRDGAALIGGWSNRESLVGVVKGQVGVGEGEGVEIGVEKVVGWTGIWVGAR